MSFPAARQRGCFRRASLANITLTTMRPHTSRTLPRWMSAPIALFLSFVPFLLLPVFPVGEARAEQISKWEWDGVPRIVAMGDVHGHVDKLTAILRGTGIIDSKLRWSGGSNHVVLCGDLVDRGPDDRGILDFLQRLQKESEKQGGRVHTLVGNHDLMNLVRDFRFVSAESYADFAKDEGSKEREAAWEAFEQYAESIPDKQMKAAFNERFPPGYFAHQRAFGSEGKYGSWLAKQPIVVKVNGIVFLHGGLTPEVAALGLDEINRQFHESIRLVFDSFEVLAPVVAGVPTYGNLAGAALYVVQNEAKVEEWDAERQPLPEELVTAARTFLEQTQTIPYQADGPLWYRGNSVKTEAEELARFERVLELLDARAVMVGHTSTRTGVVTTRFGGRLYRGDVGMGSGRPPRAVVFQNGGAIVYDPGADTYSPPQVERPESTGSQPGDADASAEPGDDAHD